jgi:undecaprenyl-phosphate galactose phosphotransferase
MKSLYSRLILIFSDSLTLFISIAIALLLRHLFQDSFELPPPSNSNLYIQFWLLYIVMFLSFYSLGIYRNRFDFWQELQRIIKGVFYTLIIILSVLVMTKQTEDYSRFILVLAFVITAMILPFQKYFLKHLLFRMGLWGKEARMVGNDPFFAQHVFDSPYLGYIPSKENRAKTLFVASSHTKEQIETILHEALLSKQEVIFIPAVKSFDFSDAHIIHLFNARSNLIIVENNLLKKFNRFIKAAIDYLSSLLILPLLLLVIGIIAWRIKREDGGTVFFKQTRLGQDSQEFGCYKFRSMRENSDELLKSYLAEHPEEVEYYDAYHKYQNDPRITKIGAFIRKTSLDELPQILNVLKGEMSLIGPRPYMPNEQVKIGDNVDMILAVKPGITGLWQVSGRSDVDFSSRVEMDVWYVRNWNIWSDIIILIKTVQVVFGSKGSY